MQFRRISNPIVARQGAQDPGPRSPRRRRGLRRYVLLLLGVLLIAAVFVINRTWISAQGIVVGELGQVSALAQSRITKLHAKCLDFVSPGQVVADLDNPTTAQTAAQQLQQLQLQLNEAKASVEIAKKEAEAAGKYRDAQLVVQQQLTSLLRAQSDLAKKNYVAPLVFEKAKYDVAKAEAESAAADLVVQSKLQDQKRAELDAQMIDQRIASFRGSPELQGTYELRAPKAGFLTQCNATVGSAVAADTPLFQIFNPSDAYVVVFVDPEDARHLAVGDRLRIRVSGTEGDLTARVAALYPELSGMPDSLTRYFWQQEKWSQFAPIRLDFVDLTDQQQRSLRSSAQVSLSLWRWPTSGVLGGIGRFLAAATGSNPGRG